MSQGKPTLRQVLNSGDYTHICTLNGVQNLFCYPHPTLDLRESKIEVRNLVIK
jgi:hypothetical protein